MTKSHARIGLTGCLLLATSLVVRAQDAAPALLAAPQPSCSGLMCIFSGHPSAQTAPTPDAQAVAPQPAPTDVNATGATADGDQAAAKKVAKVAKPVHAITIAADTRDIARLKALTTVVRKGNIKFVKSTSDDADFTVATSLNDASSDRKVKLFTEQMHVVAGGSIHSIEDLKDKVVSFGPAGSPTRAAALKAFEALTIPVKETSLDLDNAFDGLASGDIDAVVVLAPQPSDILKKLTAPGLHLVSWPDGGKLPDGAAVTTISGVNYPHLAGANDAIRAVGVDAVLSMSAKGAKQPAARSFLASLTQHSAALSKRGFDLLKADLEDRSGRRVASVERR